MGTTTRYLSVVSTLDLPSPAWVTDKTDQLRIAAYDGYQAMYDNVPDTFKTAMRGDNDKPLYAPGAKRIVETKNRYLARDFAWTVVSGSNNTNDVLSVTTALNTLAVREEITAKFYSLKRQMLTKGDAAWHITLDPNKQAGSRISITELDPRTMFRIPNKVNDTITDGWYLVDLIYADDGKTQIARRLEYRKDPVKGTITSRLSFYEPNGWDDRYPTSPALKVVATPKAYGQDPAMQALLGGVELDPKVTALPVYHFRNQRSESEDWGTSEIAGLETLVVGINQSISDEDFSLALQGLGLYVTDSPRPVNDAGETVDWMVSPGTVLEIRGAATKFERVQGISSVAPYQDHINRLLEITDQAAAIPMAAAGKVTAEVAASGVALRLEMAPILASNEEKETELLARSDQFFYDLVHMWMTQDGLAVADDIVVVTAVADPLPQDRAAIITEVTGLVAAGLMSRDFAIKYLGVKLGFQFPPTMVGDIRNELDEAGERVLQELGTDIGDPNATPAAPAAAGAVS